MTLLIAGEFERAYRLTTDEYQSSHSVPEFQSAFDSIEGNKYYEPGPATVISFGVASGQVYGFEIPGFFELLNGPIFFYVKEHGELRFTGKIVMSLD